MNSLRKWLYRPKKTDTSLLAQFFFADEELNLVAAELDSFDGRKDPERCTALVNQLRVCQDKVLSVIQKIMDEEIEGQRANRDFRVKFPDDVLQENLAGQLWFGAECLAAGSSIMNREVESASMRPLARALTKNLDSLRCILRDQCLRNVNEYNERIMEALVIFDKLFAEFELSYVSAMVPVKTMKEYDMLQEITVLFSETVQRALKIGLLSQDMLDDCDPALMFTIPRLAIVGGLLVYPEGPLNPDMEAANMSEMFRPFLTLLYKIRELLYTLSPVEFSMLEKSLCSSEEPGLITSPEMHPEQFYQIDQGFDEGQDPQGTHAEGMGTPLFVHSPNSGSPVTPVNNLMDLPNFVPNSPSSSTIVEGNFQLPQPLSPSFVQTDDTGDMFSSLNKSESHDSGLHSENVSTSDTVTLETVPLNSACDLNCDSSQRRTSDDVDSEAGEATLNSSQRTSAQEGEATPVAVSSEESEWTSESGCLKSCCRPELGSGVRHMCREIVEELSDRAVSVALDRSLASNNASGISRQYSWQYNVQFEIPRISVLDRETGTSPNDPQGSHMSLSSESTLSGGDLALSDQILNALVDINIRDQSDSSSLHNSTTQTYGNRDLSTRERTHSNEMNSHDRVRALQRATTAVRNNRANSDSDIRVMQDTVVIQTRPSSHHSSKSKTKRDRTNRNSFERIHCKTGSHRTETGETSGECLDPPRIQRLRYTESISSCSSCRSVSSVGSECEQGECEQNCSCVSSETSSYNSETNDEEEIALAIQAAELASRNEARSKFKSSSDLIHRLFVCIAGVADQLQTNYAADLRHILKAVFDMNCSSLPPEEDGDVNLTSVQTEPEQSSSGEPSPRGSPYRARQTGSPRRALDPPPWVPDEESSVCMSCKISFSFVRRRHHCRNCGKIFCGRCSANSVPLPQFGHQKPVRVCNKCFVYQVTHFTVDD